MKVKKYMKRLVPKKLIMWIRRQKALPDLNKELSYIKKRVLHFSGTFNQCKNSSLASLLVVSHVLEKGITMPERHLGFGVERVRDIIKRCNDVIDKWGSDSIELQAALADLKQYYDIHVEEGYKLPKDISEGINKLLPNLTINDSNCFSTTNNQYFGPTTDFFEFAESRHSVRWFSNTPVDDNKLMAAIRLAQTAPSACNRQATRVKIISSAKGKELCQSLQNGNRGFGDRADKWILITTELSDWTHIDAISAGYIDAGIFTMNLLYALHYYGIAACTLNAYLKTEDRIKLQTGLGYPASELPVLFIIIGNPAENFMVPRSRRLNLDDIIQKI